MIFRKAEPTDFDLIKKHYLNLMNSSPRIQETVQWRPDAYPTDSDWQRYMDNGEMYILAEGAQILGTEALVPYQTEAYHGIHWENAFPDDDVCVIHLLAVSPDCTGRGIGSRLVDEGISVARLQGKKSVRLDAVHTNLPACRLYEKKGFRLCETAKLFYECTGLTEFLFYEYTL